MINTAVKLNPKLFDKLPRGSNHGFFSIGFLLSILLVSSVILGLFSFRKRAETPRIVSFEELKSGTVSAGRYEVTGYVERVLMGACYNGGCLPPHVFLKKNNDSSDTIELVAKRDGAIMNTIKQGDIEAGREYKFQLSVEGVSKKSVEIDDFTSVVSDAIDASIESTFEPKKAESFPKTIEEAVRRSGGVYMDIDPTASPEDVASTLVNQGLTNSDASSGTVLLPGIQMYGRVHSDIGDGYTVLRKMSETGRIVVRPDHGELFIKILGDDGTLLDRPERSSTGEYVASLSFIGGKPYRVLVYRDPYEKSEVVFYTISYKHDTATVQ